MPFCIMAFKAPGFLYCFGSQGAFLPAKASSEMLCQFGNGLLLRGPGSFLDVCFFGIGIVLEVFADIKEDLGQWL